MIETLNDVFGVEKGEKTGYVILGIVIVNLVVLLFLVVLLLRKRTYGIDDFISMVSHDLRTPLNAICGYSEILSYNKTLDERAQNQIAVIRDSSTMMLNLINEMLDHAKVQSGKLVVIKESFNIIDKVNSLKHLHSVVAQNKGIELIVKSTDISETDMMTSDSLRLTQVLNNLVANAIKFTNQGYVIVEFIKGQRHLCINVIDTGVGMTPFELKKLFKKFSQANNNTHRKYGGTGLGLFISRDLVHLMKGTISLSSEKGKGTEIKIKLPLHI